jgi:hypothetical protein
MSRNGVEAAAAADRINIVEKRAVKVPLLCCGPIPRASRISPQIQSGTRWIRATTILRI